MRARPRVISRRRRCPGRTGMTLIEVLVAILILSVGATSLIALFASASSTHKRSVDRTHAALIAEELFCEVQARYFIDAEPRDILADLRQSLPERITDYYWQVTLYRPGDGEGWSPGELVVHVVIRWSRAVESHEERYSTILLPRLRGS